MHRLPCFRHAPRRSTWCPASEVRDTSLHPLARTPEAKGHYQAYDSSAAFRFEVPDRVGGRWCRNFKSAALGPRFCGDERKTVSRAQRFLRRLPPFFFGTFFPFLRALACPMPIACLRLFTFFTL